MHELEVKILNNLIGLEINEIVFSKVVYDFQNPKSIIAHDGLSVRFINKSNRKNFEYLEIEPASGLSTGGSFVLLKHWKYEYKPLKLSLHYPQQSLDSKYNTSFNVSYLGTLQKVTAFAHSHIPEGQLSLHFENGNMFMIIADRVVSIYLDNQHDDEAFFRIYYNTDEKINVVSIS